jgi:hypothetical protein
MHHKCLYLGTNHKHPPSLNQRLIADGGLSRRITPSLKIRVRFPHTCKGLVIRVVSACLCLSACANEAVSSLLPVFDQGPLGPGEEYFGPAGVDNSNLCKCNTVTYSLVSACGACQAAPWITYDFHPLLSSSLIPIFMFLPLDGPNG